MNRLSTRAKHVRPAYLNLFSLSFITLILVSIFIASTTVASASDQDEDTDVTTSTNGTETNSTSTNIIGGEETAPGAYPWMVGIIDNDNEYIFWAQYCGGTIVHPEWVLTAAHCTYKFGRELEPSDIDILVGQEELKGTTGERVAVTQIIRHAGHNKKTGDADIALIKLAQPVTQPTVTLADSSMLNVAESGAVGTVLGWGRTSTGPRVNHLHQVNVPLVSTQTCRNTYERLEYTMTDNMICAGYADGGYDACSGDSGGPLVIREVEGDETSEWIQAGIVSWGRGCAQPNAYGVYVHVAQLTDWVNVQIAINTLATNAGSTIVMPTGQSNGASVIFMPIINQ